MPIYGTDAQAGGHDKFVSRGVATIVDQGRRYVFDGPLNQRMISHEHGMGYMDENGQGYLWFDPVWGEGQAVARPEHMTQPGVVWRAMDTGQVWMWIV